MPFKRTIILGLDLDDPLPLFASGLGVLQAGPQGFLRFLETELGAEAPVDPARRILRAEEALASCNSASRFYHASFERSSLAAAERVLELRDELLLSGANPSGAPGRLADFGALEATGLLAGGLADRIRFVMRQLDEADYSNTSIQLADPAGEFPVLLLGLLEALKSRGAQVSELAFRAHAKKGTALALFQSSLAGEDTRGRADPDDSLRILRTATDALAAEITARICGGNSAAVYDPAASGLLLAEAFGASGPHPGARLASAARPAMQILPAALSLLWESFDPEAAILFLSLPLCPIPHHAARKLLRSLGDEAGTENEKWKKAAAEAVEKAGKRGPQVQEFLDLLLQRREYYPAASAPAAEIRRVVESIKKWAQKEMHSGGELLISCFALCEKFEALLPASGSISRLRVEQLLALLLKPARSDLPLEKGAPVFFSKPGALIRPVHTLILWNFTEDAAAPPPVDFWNRSEREWARSRGAVLPDRSIRSQAHRLARMMSLAENLIVCIPDTVRSVPAAPHPWVERMLLTFKDAESLRERTEFQALKGVTTTEIKAARAVPAGDWQVRPVPVRKEFSHSRLGQLFYSMPDYAWQEAGVYGSPFPALRTRTLLDRGNVIHEILERALTKKKPGEWSEDEFKTWVQSELRTVLRELAAHFLKPQFSEFARDLEARAGNLGVLLAALAKLRCPVRSEVELKGKIGAQSFTGYADVIADAGRPVILDLKPGGFGDRIEQIKKGRALQLHIYSELLNGGSCDIGYFLAGTAEILSTSQALGGIHVPQTADAHARIMTALADVLAMRTRELQGGTIRAAIDSDSHKQMIKDGAWPECLEFDSYAASSDYAGLRGEKQ